MYSIGDFLVVVVVDSFSGHHFVTCGTFARSHIFSMSYIFVFLHVLLPFVRVYCMTQVILRKLDSTALWTKCADLTPVKFWSLYNEKKNVSYDEPTS